MITFLVYLLLHFIKAATANPEHILINCGSLGKSKSPDGQIWDGDFGTDLSPNFNTPYSSIPETYIDGSVPYRSARIIKSNCSYIFPVSTGQKALRLYFSPIDRADSFDVTANQYNLMRYIRSNQTAASVFVTEFFINVEQNQNLHLTFWPSADSIAFINGIEIVSIPAGFYLASFPAHRVDPNQTALETVYRLNVGGPPVTAVDDDGMFRAWWEDAKFITGESSGRALSNTTVSVNYNSQTPNYSAPAIVYQTARLANTSVGLTWMFPVDMGYQYLLRLHFCQFMPDADRHLLLDVFINNVTAARGADIKNWTGGAGIPIFRDYLVSVPHTSDKVLNLNLTLRHHASLNGLEIFKLKIADVVVHPGRGSMFWIGILAGGGGGLLLLLLSLFIISQLWRRRRFENVVSSEPTVTSASSGPSLSHSLSLPSSELCRRFLLEEIQSATSNFDPTLVVGTGGFGTVYRGFINNTTVAFKRLNSSSHQGACEFRTEIKVLCNLRHAHLVSLLGYSDDNDEMILAYDYMSNGTLRDHLYGTEKSQTTPLTWQQRLEICIGAARGLHYLHRGGKPNVIHRDVKSNNILLDEKWVAKISDFGLSKSGEPDQSFTHISTNVKGTFGYLDPKYFTTRKLTRKSDVYAFGVVLFEVLSGRAAVDMQLADEQKHSLATWASYCITNGQVEKLIDSKLREEIILPASLEVFVGIAGRCLDTNLHERPAMADVVVSLEFALELQRNPSSAQQVQEKINVNVCTISREKPCREFSCIDLLREQNTTRASCGNRHYMSM